MNAKQEIENLINYRTFGSLDLSRDAILIWNAKTDELTIDFMMLATITHEKKDIISYNIKSRDYSGIVSEILRAQTCAYAKTADFLNDELAHGYIRR